ncbi:MAG: hypothetical protein SCALA702_09170 [Melioribacteraceae bacterium]|nr:MAG: hypothetical protein SCALA702_09170 [Melioribacteraceae bacterium]
MLKKILLILLLTGLTSAMYGSGWPVKKGSGYFQMSAQYMGSDKYYDSDGDKVDIPKFSDFTISLFGSYGVTDKISVYGSFPFMRFLTTENSITGGEATNTGLSDFTLGMKYYLGKLAGTYFSAKVSVGIPVGDNEDENFLFTGDGEWNQYFAIAAGRSLGNGFYVGADAGFSNRNEGYSDDILYNAEVGYKVSTNLLVILKINGKQPLENGSNIQFGGVAGLAANNQKYLAYGPELLYSINDKIGLNAALQTGTNTANVISALVFKGGLYYKL